MREFEDLPEMPVGYEVPQYILKLLENFDVALYQLSIDPDPFAHLNLIRNLYVHDLIVASILILNMPKAKEPLVTELSLQLEIMESLTSPVRESEKN